jgi:hypothetical protein
MRCTKCYAVHYCARECQAKDWKSHKTTCVPGPKPVEPAPAVTPAAEAVDAPVTVEEVAAPITSVTLTP